MNDLQITLLIVGGSAIAAMVAYNWWQDFQLRRQADERFGFTESDPLLAGHRTEPNLGAARADLTEPAIENQLQEPLDKALFLSLW
ncbi:MAG: hypothetical protein HC848_10465 [Limnobacter sp.]|nr:hypothetical protein [Limnobacter sp.]